MKTADAQAVEMVTAAYQGERGANSQAALFQYFGMDANAVQYVTFEAVVQAVLAGEADYGVLPVENMLTGGIEQVQELLERYDVQVKDYVEIDIVHDLLGVSGATLEEIREVYSHEQALLQCAGFLDGHPHMRQHTYPNTASAAKYVAELGEKCKAAIASPRTATLYGLETIAHDIGDGNENHTKFVVIIAHGQS